QAPTDNGSAGLGSLKLVQLRNLATQLGITGTSRMRKAQLVDVITDHQRGGSVADRQVVEEAKAAAAKEQKGRSTAPKSTKSDTKKSSTQQASQKTQPQAEESKTDQQAATETAQKSGTATRSRRTRG